MLTFLAYKVLRAGPPGPLRWFIVRETTLVTLSKPRLLDRARTALRARHDSRRTEGAYARRPR